MNTSKPWFRYHTDTLFSAKVQNLSANLFRTLVNVWCVAARHGGTLPNLKTLSFELQMRESAIRSQLDELSRHGLIDCTDGVYTPHDWNEWQYSSDSSTERVRRFRNGQETFSKRSTKQPRNVSETAPEQNRTEQTPIVPNGNHGFDASEVASRLMGIWPQNRRGSVTLVGAALCNLLADAVAPEAIAARLEAAAVPYLASVSDPQYVRRLDRWIDGGEWADSAPPVASKPQRTKADYEAEAARHRIYREDADGEVTQ